MEKNCKHFNTIKYIDLQMVDCKGHASPSPYISQSPVGGLNSCLQAIVFFDEYRNRKVFIKVIVEKDIL